MPLSPPWVSVPPSSGGSSSAGLVQRYATSFGGDDTDFAAGGTGTTATLDGVTWTSHNGATSGASANTFSSSSSGLRIQPDYQTKIPPSASNPEAPILWALVDDMQGGTWDGLSSICVQVKMAWTVAPSANFEGAGLVFWDGSAWLAFHSYAYNGELVTWQGVRIGGLTEHKTAQGSVPVVLEAHISRAGLVDVYHYTSWSGDWPTPFSGTRVDDASFSPAGAISMGSSNNRPVDTSTRVGLFAMNNNAVNDIDVTFEQFRLLEMVP